MARAIDAVYVRYQVTDIDKQEAFMTDFGLTAVKRTGERVYMRGTGTAPCIYIAERGSTNKFLGAGLQVSSREDLEQLSRLPDSGPVEAADTPGGGWRVRMRMPDGFEIDAIYGAEAATPLGLPERRPFNNGHERARSNASVRIQRAVAPAMKLGHFVLHVLDHDASVVWMKERFGMLASDYLAVPGEPDHIIGTFMRVDLGAKPTEHHCMLVLQTENPGCHHCSFELPDLDSVMAAHDYLVSKGYELDCGVGRHLLGSQIFDYWRDPFGFRVEHYTDGDVVDCNHKPTVFAGTAEETTQWGAAPPAEFFH